MRSRVLHHLTKPVEHDLRRLGALIRDARANRGFTQADLAARLRISPTTVGAAGIGPMSANLASKEAELGPARAHRKRVRPDKAPDDF